MRRTIGRRAALLLPLATAGCGIFDDWFAADKPKLPGKRLPVLAANRGLQVDNPDGRRIALPPPLANASWPQAGGVASHSVGHLQAADVLREVWRAEIGAGGGYRRKITASPVVADGRVLTMDSDGVVTAFATADGRRLWRTETQGEKDRSTNVGGGIALDGGRVFAATGRAEVLALEASSGKITWRVGIGTAARAAPTIAEGTLFVPTIDDQLLALSSADGKRLWAYQAGPAETSVLGLPSPAYAEGLVVAGFASGELVALRADGGSVAWADSLAATRGRTSLIDLSAIHGAPVIDQGAVFASGLGGLTVALDLRSGRRLWEREVGSAETPWLAGDWLFLLASDNDVVALNRTDGSLAWITPLPSFQDAEKQRDPIHWVGPTLVGDRLILAGSIKRAVAISPYTGKVLGRQDLTGAAALAPVVAAGTVYLVTDDAALLALR